MAGGLPNWCSIGIKSGALRMAWVESYETMTVNIALDAAIEAEIMTKSERSRHGGMVIYDYTFHPNVRPNEPKYRTRGGEGRSNDGPGESKKRTHGVQDLDSHESNGRTQKQFSRSNPVKQFTQASNTGAFDEMGSSQDKPLRPERFSLRRKAEIKVELESLEFSDLVEASEGVITLEEIEAQWPHNKKSIIDRLFEARLSAEAEAPSV
jgi:hypothetical protein